MTCYPLVAEEEADAGRLASSTKVLWYVFTPGQRYGLIGERVTFERPPRGRETGCAELHDDSVARVAGVLSELRIGQRSWRWHVPLRPVCVLEVAALVVAQER